MDPVTHTLIGVGIANAFVRRRIGFPAVPILAVASNLPDVDALVHLWGDQSAILMRRTFGHSVFTIPIWSLALALIFRRAYPALPLRTTWGLVGLGASVHVFFDLVNSFGVVPLWPLSEWRPEFAVIFIVDLVLTGLVAAPLLLGLVSSMRPHIELLSRVCLVVAALYAGVCWTGRAMAEDALSAWIARGEAHPEWVYVFPEPLGPHRWRGVFREQNAYRVFLIAVPSRRVKPRGEVRTAVDDLRVRQVRETPLGRRLDWFFKAPVWMVEPSERSRAPAEHPRDVVSAYDLRFRSLVVERPPPFVFRFLVGEHGVVRRWDGEGAPVKLPVKVVPKASRNYVAGWMGETLKVCVTAPPERGKANAAVEEVLADALGLPTGRVRVVVGHTSPRKIVEIDGLEEAEVRRRLAP